MRDGEGSIELLHFDSKDRMKNCRLLSQITIPAGGSIGEHIHENETEYFILLEGEAEVDDNGTIEQASPGEVIKTGDGASHSIKNIGTTPLKLIAVIITH